MLEQNKTRSLSGEDALVGNTCALITKALATHGMATLGISHRIAPLLWRHLGLQKNPDTTGGARSRTVTRQICKWIDEEALEEGAMRDTNDARARDQCARES